MCPLPLRCFSDQAACQRLGVTQVTTAILKYLRCCFRSHLPHSVPYYYRLAICAGMVTEEL